MTICIIPARAGSKRIPHKNTKSFHGEPIVCRAMALAKDVFDVVAVSTDDFDVIKYAQKAGVDYVPRSDRGASDSAELEDVVHEVLDWYDEDFDTCCLLLPTGVFANREDIDSALATVEIGLADLAYAVTEYDHPPQRAMRIRDGKIRATFSMSNTQDFETMYHDAGQFYVFNVMSFRQSWNRGIRLLQMDAKPIILETDKCHDIDTLADWKIAEMKWEAMQ